MESIEDAGKVVPVIRNFFGCANKELNVRQFRFFGFAASYFNG